SPVNQTVAPSTPPLSLHDALPIYEPEPGEPRSNLTPEPHQMHIHSLRPIADDLGLDVQGFALLEQRSAVRDFWDDDEVRRIYYPDRKSTRLNSSHGSISYAVFCLK